MKFVRQCPRCYAIASRGDKTEACYRCGGPTRRVRVADADPTPVVTSGYASVMTSDFGRGYAYAIDNIEKNPVFKTLVDVKVKEVVAGVMERSYRKGYEKAREEKHQEAYKAGFEDCKKVGRTILKVVSAKWGVELAPESES